MKRGTAHLNLSMYWQAIPKLVTHPAIFVVPLLAALIDILVESTSRFMTDPLGGFAQGLFQFFVQIVYLVAFGVAVIYASNIWRGGRANFDSAWEEGVKKAGGIAMAAIGFQFIVYAAAYVGSILGSFGQIALQLLAYFFLILTIPAAAIGGLPGAMAVSGSIRAVRANVLGSLILAIVFVALWVYLPIYLSPHIVNALVLVPAGYTVIAYNLTIALIHAIVLAYLAFPFAKQYDETAFRGLY